MLQWTCCAEQIVKEHLRRSRACGIINYTHNYSLLIPPPTQAYCQTAAWARLRLEGCWISHFPVSWPLIGSGKWGIMKGRLVNNTELTTYYFLFIGLICVVFAECKISRTSGYFTFVILETYCRSCCLSKWTSWGLLLKCFNFHNC